jgi:hypothetical protein
MPVDGRRTRYIGSALILSVVASSLLSASKTDEPDHRLVAHMEERLSRGRG